MNEEKKRRCRKCDKLKPIGQFRLANKKWRRRVCNSCINEYRKEWHKKNPQSAERHKAIVRQRNRQQKEQVFDHYGRKCACCDEGEFEFLQIDHVGGGGKKHKREIGKRTIYTWLIRNNFPDGFQTLCANCNHAKGRLGVCPHKQQPSYSFDIPELKPRRKRTIQERQAMSILKKKYWAEDIRSEKIKL
jgi:hypothetical protein